jgi:single-strand DNA-binding protein
MAGDLNKVILVGRVVRDPELRYTPGGSAVVSFSVANNRIYLKNNEKQEVVSFFNCVAWGKLAETVANYCKKGQQLALEGRLQQRSWQDKEGNKRSTVEIVAESLQFLGGKPQADSQVTIEQDEPVDINTDQPFADDEIPF